MLINRNGGTPIGAWCLHWEMGRREGVNTGVGHWNLGRALERSQGRVRGYLGLGVEAGGVMGGRRGGDGVDVEF